MDKSSRDARAAFPPPTGLALASLLLGIAAVGLSFILIGIVLGLIGASLGIAYLSKKRGPRTMAFWGIGLSALGILAGFGFAALFFQFFKTVAPTMAGSFGSGGVTIGGDLGNVPALSNGSPVLKTNLVWSKPVQSALALCAGDWQGDGSTRVLVAGGLVLHVLDLNGKEQSSFKLPSRFTSIECGRSVSAGPRLLAYSPWDVQIVVFDRTGKVAWKQGFGMGVNGAHWGDLDGDGNDEMVVGLNAFGGLEAISSEGKKLWMASLGKVSSQAIIPAALNRPALVLATDASGSINIFDSAGHRQSSIRHGGGYYAVMTAGATESNTVQILGFTGNSVVAFDPTGKAAWTSSAISKPGDGRACAVIGDFKGNGTRQWAFLDGNGDLIIATTGGIKIAAIPNQANIKGLAAAPRQGRSSLLLTLNAGMVRAFSFGP